MPAHISIEPTTSCNLRCPQCPSGLREFSRPTGMLDPLTFRAIIQDLKRELHSLTFYFQGEPYLHPGFTDMVAYASEQNIFTITSTNAHYLNEEKARQTVLSGLDKLIISIDGTEQETYANYRVGGQLDKVLEGTRQVLEQKKRLKRRNPHVVWQFVVFGNNEHQVNEIKRMGKKMGVDEVKIKTAQIYDVENSKDLLPKNQRYSRYKMDSNGVPQIKNKMLDQCWRMWQGCVITWDGKVVPCCFDKDAHHQLGNLGSENFRTIWHSPAYNTFRQAVMSSRKSIDICTNCTEGTQVWA